MNMRVPTEASPGFDAVPGKVVPGRNFPTDQTLDVRLALGLVAHWCPIGDEGLTAHFAPSRPKLLNLKPSDSKHASDNFDRKR